MPTVSVTISDKAMVVRRGPFSKSDKVIAWIVACVRSVAGGRGSLYRYVAITLFAILMIPQLVYSYDRKSEASVYIKKDGKVPVIVVNGAITGKTVANLRTLIPKITKQYVDGGPVVWLNSSGGDVDAAIEAGYLFRGYGVHVVIPENASCESACVFMLAGATARSVRGKVGIHRPYYPNSNVIAVSKRKKEYVNMGERIRKFFMDVNIPVTLYDEMLTVPPREIRFLSKEDLLRTGLGKNNPYYAAPLSTGK